MNTHPERRAMTGISERDFGRLEAEVIGLKVQNLRSEAELKELRQDVAKMMTLLTEVQGGAKVIWKMLAAAGAFGTAFGVALVKLITYTKGG